MRKHHAKRLTTRNPQSFLGRGDEHAKLGLKQVVSIDNEALNERYLGVPNGSWPLKRRLF